MKNIKSILVFIIFIVILILIIGSIPLFFHNVSSQNLDSQKTFSDGSISFNYTGNYKNKTNNYDEKGWLITQFEGINSSIQVKKNLVFKDPHIAQQESNMSQVLSITEETNSNGIKIIKSIAKYGMIKNSRTYYYIDLYFKDKNNVVYDLRVYDFNGDYKGVSKRVDELFNSLTLN